MYLGAIAVLVFTVVVATLAILDIRTVFKSPLITAIGFFFTAAIAFVVAYISAKSYLQYGSPLILLLGNGVLALGSASLLGALAVALLGAGNIPATILETGLLVASALHFQSAFVALLGAPLQEVQQNRRAWVMLASLGVVMFLAWLTIATFQGVTPAFYIEKVGTTPLQNWVTGASSALFAMSFLILMRLYLRSRSDILYWYSLALALIAAGRFASSLIEIADTPIHWVARFAQYLGAVYLLVTVLISVKGGK